MKSGLKLHSNQSMTAMGLVWKPPARMGSAFFSGDCVAFRYPDRGIWSTQEHMGDQDGDGQSPSAAVEREHATEWTQCVDCGEGTLDA